MKAPKKKSNDLDEDDLAFLEKKRAGTNMSDSLNSQDWTGTHSADKRLPTDEKARKELASKAGGKGPLNTGGQGIKKSGKK